jgi:hypothetical protein
MLGGNVMRFARLMLGLVAALLVQMPLWAQPSAAQGWPQRNVRFIVPLGAGSGADIGARLLAERLSQKWGQPVVVEKRRRYRRHQRVRHCPRRSHPAVLAEFVIHGAPLPA